MALVIHVSREESAMTTVKVAGNKACSILGFVACGLISVGSNAATLLVDDGQLIGARDVIVDGKALNVDFVDSSCFSIFAGCDSQDDFLFKSKDEVTAASIALIDQVFLNTPAGDFDSKPSLTHGCERDSSCVAYTPFDAAFNGAAWQVSVVGALNRNNIGTTDNITVELQLFALEDLGGPFSDPEREVYAVWSVPPEETMTVSGTAGDDVLIVDLTTGSYQLNGGASMPVAGNLRFDGLGQQLLGDSLVLTGTQASSVSFGFINEHDGSVDVDGRLITYTGLEPIDLSIDASKLVFDFRNNGVDEITLSDDETTADGMSTIDSTSGELVNFLSVNTSIIEILLGVGDIFVNNGVDELFSGQLVVRREDAAVVPAPTTVFLMLVAMAGFNRLKSSRR